MDRTAVNKIESGARKVSALELAEIARALRTRMSSFFEEPTPAIVSHRSTRGLEVIDSQIDDLLGELASDVELVKELGALERRDTDAEAEVVPADVQSAEMMAMRARGAFGLDAEEPVRDIQQVLAPHGLWVFARELGADTADAGTVLLRDGSAVSIVNSTQKVGRRRLAAAHELGHFLVQDDYCIDWDVTAGGHTTESMLDWFARAFLAPADGLRTLWEQKLHDGLRAAAVIAGSRFRIDMATLARRLRDLELIDPEQAGRIRAIRTTGADMIEYDLHKHDELAATSQPRLYQQAVLRLVRDELISTHRAIDLLWGTLEEAELPEPYTRDENDIWQFVS